MNKSNKTNFILYMQEIEFSVLLCYKLEFTDERFVFFSNLIHFVSLQIKEITNAPMLVYIVLMVHIIQKKL